MALVQRKQKPIEELQEISGEIVALLSNKELSTTEVKIVVMEVKDYVDARAIADYVDIMRNHSNMVTELEKLLAQTHRQPTEEI